MTPAVRTPLGGKAPPVLSGGWPLLGHLGALRKDPIALFQRVRDELGEIGEINFAGNRVVMLAGEEAQEAFFRGSDEQLDLAAAYPFITPIFGKAWSSMEAPSSESKPSEINPSRPTS